MFRGLILIVVVATFIGAMMPGRARAPAEGNAAAGARPWFGDDDSASASSSSGDSQGWGRSAHRDSGEEGGEVRLTRDGNGHFYADVDVNGTNVEFMIDTGATGIAMTAEDARRAGVDLDPGERSYVGEGAGGALTGQQVRLDRVRLGSHTAEGMRAVVIDGASTNLLGQSFLSQFSEVTVRGDVMTLR
jgi:aspartyl protease family protein